MKFNDAPGFWDGKTAVKMVLKIVLTHLGLPVELPIQLTFAQQAAFAAETIRRLDANGKFGSIHY